MYQSRPVRTAARAAFRPQFSRTRQVALLTALVAGAIFGSVPVHAAVATATSSSTVVAPIAITRFADLAFGKFAAAGGGSVTVSTSGARSSTGGVVLMNGGTTTAARFDVTGDSGATFSIALGGTAVLTSGSDTMAFATVSDLTGANGTSGNVSSGTLTAGAQSIYVGGVLTVGASQPAGTYAGTVTATVEYN